ncbi:geranylgeranyl pyrophosphate synthase [Oenococcus oeni]|uniref:Heptaprenyl diphosphate synthase, component II n=1 Tax=Oenococcus oeni TaxID=1247 RepID=A0AAQ2ZFB7_OENOE|nr:polyprenyl synthetase family protein [Oenococcus oeni]OIL37187.1 geranylgeranyl pyrophosphate synthase [Oenococcus oeni]OIM23434.1 geranylgeranyl pyrophosphate synthase [Oenococcus oeni]OLQ38152.1 geranylgeranyl pyrophosphate synthase [Oenococcus oeni]SYW06740.1 putative Heptaprenyl diphosphate synthase, component II [Oenococcus oeni]VDB99385.1 putative Heptaprenyl diphosphate synthase, component II [Oenococcus oeni]
MTEFFGETYSYKQDIEKVKEILAQQHFNVEPYREKTEVLIQNNGKMIRALITILFGRYTLAVNQKNYDQETVFSIDQCAAAIELLHLATLVHDDVIDNAEKRRGLTTLQNFFGNKNTIYLGDILFTKYFYLLTSLAPSKEFIAYHSSAMEKVLTGELIQDALKFHKQTTLAEYYQAIKGKTATLFSLSAVSGVWLGKKNKQFDEDNLEFKNAFNFGYNLGMAFQMLDDLKDLNPLVKNGKPKFEDLKAGIYTLPIILALKDKSFQKILNKGESNPFIIENYFIENPDYLKRCKDIIDHFLNEAQKALEFLIDSPESDQLNSLLTNLRLNLENYNI